MEWNKGLRVWRNNKEHAVITVEINIYGPRQDAEAVGTVLTKAALFLQQPRYNPESKDYFNPHYIRLVDSLDGIYTTPTIFTGDDIELGEAVAVNQTSTSEISSILDTLSHRGYLRNGTTDRRIKSVLLEYVFCVSYYITPFRDILL
jgi:SWI/SNF-related matrix-associated actin-dependent regulator of chromatin subfamily A3